MEKKEALKIFFLLQRFYKTSRSFEKIEAFLRCIYEPKRKKEEIHRARAMNSPLEPAFFFNRPSIAKDEAHALHRIPAQAAGASSVCSNEKRRGVRRCRRRRGEKEDNEKKTRQEPRSFSSMHAL